MLGRGSTSNKGHLPKPGNSYRYGMSPYSCLHYRPLFVTVHHKESCCNIKAVEFSERMLRKRKGWTGIRIQTLVPEWRRLNYVVRT